ncbi:MAG: dihydrodipicolinate synthase family protein [Reinekea sp.]
MVALATPFRIGEVVAVALAHLVHWLIYNGTLGIVAVGTSGEADCLNHRRLLSEPNTGRSLSTPESRT